MDKREMKKQIKYLALLRLNLFDSEYSLYETVGEILDKDRIDVTRAQVRRFVELLDEMLENASSKVA